MNNSTFCCRHEHGIVSKLFGHCHSPLTTIILILSTMHQLVAQVVQNQKTVFGIIGLFLCTYFFTMDTILYVKFQAVELWKEKKVDGAIWSPFHPLSPKIIMSDHVTHYILTPMSEYFNHITRFSDIFYFITPNMISFSHLLVGFIAARFFVYSESLHNRRIGVLLFEFRILLDGFDGTVYRARAGTNLYTSNHSNLGFWIDSTCDTIAGFFLCFAILFYFWWKWNPSKEDPGLPWVQEKDSTKIANEKHIERTIIKPSKRFIFIRCLCYGATVGISSAFWDSLVGKCDEVFLKELPTAELQVVTLSYSNHKCLLF